MAGETRKVASLNPYACLVLVKSFIYWSVKPNQTYIDRLYFPFMNSKHSRFTLTERKGTYFKQKHQVESRKIINGRWGKGDGTFRGFNLYWSVQMSIIPELLWKLHKGWQVHSSYTGGVGWVGRGYRWHHDVMTGHTCWHPGAEEVQETSNQNQATSHNGIWQELVKPSALKNYKNNLKGRPE